MQIFLAALLLFLSPVLLMSGAETNSAVSYNALIDYLTKTLDATEDQNGCIRYMAIEAMTFLQIRNHWPTSENLSTFDEKSLTSN